jgi:hypothetical protein
MLPLSDEAKKNTYLLPIKYSTKEFFSKIEIEIFFTNVDDSF